MSRLAVCPENGLSVGAELRNVARVENRLALVFHAAARRLIKLQEAARPTVVLPQPDSPTRPSVSPGLIANEISSTALSGVVFQNPFESEILLEVLYLDQIFMAHR